MNDFIEFMNFKERKNCCIRDIDNIPVTDKLYMSFKELNFEKLKSLLFLVSGLLSIIFTLPILFKDPDAFLDGVMFYIFLIGCSLVIVSVKYKIHKNFTKSLVPKYLYISQKSILIGELTGLTSNMAAELVRGKNNNDKVQILKSNSLKINEIALEDITNVIVYTKVQFKGALRPVWKMHDLLIFYKNKKMILDVDKFELDKTKEAFTYISYLFSLHTGRLLPCECQELII